MDAHGRSTTCRRTNRNLRVRGHKEEGTITTPFDRRVRNDPDRFHHVEGRAAPSLSESESCHEAGDTDRGHQAIWGQGDRSNCFIFMELAEGFEPPTV